MSDGSDPRVPTLTGKILDFVTEFYHYTGWVMTAIGPQPEDTAADAMLATLRNPRPADLTAPDEATDAERTAINDAYDDLIAQLEGHGFNPDLGDAPAQAGAIRALVNAVPQRVIQDGLRRNALRGQLNGLTPPVGVTKAEADALTNDVAGVAGRLDAARGPDFDGLETDAAALAQRRVDLTEAVFRRTQTAKDLLARLALCKPPEGCQVSEAEGITLRATELAAGVVEPFQDQVLTDTDGAALTLEGDIAALAKVVTERAAAVEALLNRLATCTAPDDCLAVEGAGIETRAEDLRKALVAPFSDAMIADVSSKVDTLVADRLVLVQKVADRALAIKALQDRLAACTAPAGCVVEEGTAIEVRAGEISTTLAAPFSDDMIADATPKIDKLETDLQALVQKVAERTDAVKGLKDRLFICTPPPGCLPSERTGIIDRAKVLTDGLTVPYGDQMIVDATLGVDTLDNDLAQLLTTVQARSLRAQNQLGTLGPLAAPVGANQAEQDEIIKAVADAKALQVAPFSDLMLDGVDQAINAISLRIVAIGLAVTAREAKRKALTDRLDLLVFVDETTPAELAAFGKTRVACKVEIGKATDDAAILVADGNVDKLEKAVAAHTLFAPARAIGQTAIDAAKVTLATEGAAVDQAYQAALRAAIATAVASLAAAKIKGDVDTLVTALGLVTARLAAAKDYAAYRDTWTARTTFYVQSANDPLVTNARNAARDAAKLLAETGDYPGAKVALNAFDTAGGVNKTDLDAAEAYRLRLAAFQTAMGDMLAAIAKSKIPGADPVNQAIAAAKVEAAGGNYADAITGLNQVEPKITALHKCVDPWRKLKILVTPATPALDPTKVAVDTAEAELAGGQRGAAFNTLNALPAATKDLAAAKQRHQKLGGLAGALGSGNNAHKTWAKATLPAANTLIAGANFAALNAAMDTVEQRIAEVRAWLDDDAPVRKLQTDHDPGNAVGLMDDVDIEANAHDYPAAQVELATAAPRLRIVGEYRSAEKQVTRLIAAQVPASAGYLLATTALAEANALLNTDKKPAEALARLIKLLEDPAQLDLAAVDADWVKRLAATEARQARVRRILTDPARPEPMAELENKLTAAKDKGEVDHKYDEAAALLDTHDALLDKAAPLAAARQQMLDLNAALIRAEAAFAGNTALIYEGKPKADIATDMATADGLAQALDFTGATAAYKTLIGECKQLATNTADLYEAADKAGTNAGHSIDRHGPEVTDDELLIRLQTGMAPDGKQSFCPASSRFDDPQAWLAGREKALKEATAAGKALAQTTYPANTKDKDLRFETIIDHGGPIDRAFKGVKKNVGMKGDGTVGELQSYESYEELKGITKSKTLVLFVIDPPVGDPNTKNPKTVDAYKERFKKLAEDYNLANPLPLPQRPLVPPDIPGRWVVMQHFPLVEGWDQEKGDYV